MLCQLIMLRAFVLSKEKMTATITGKKSITLKLQEPMEKGMQITNRSWAGVENRHGRHNRNSSVG